jgi:hypothetical protein
MFGISLHLCTGRYRTYVEFCCCHLIVFLSRCVDAWRAGQRERLCAPEALQAQTRGGVWQVTTVLPIRVIFIADSNPDFHVNANQDPAHHNKN